MMLPLVSALLVQAAPFSFDPSLKVVGAVVETVDRAPFGSGILKVWHRVTVRTGGDRVMTLVSLSLSTQEPLPTPGQTCIFQYRISGMMGDPGVNGGPTTNGGRAVINSFSCDSL